MKTSHKAVLTFAITAISTLSGGNHGSRIHALLEERYIPATLIANTELSQPVEFLDLKSKRSKTTPEAGKYLPVIKKYTILPVADVPSEPAR